MARKVARCDVVAPRPLPMMQPTHWLSLTTLAAAVSLAGAATAQGKTELGIGALAKPGSLRMKWLSKAQAEVAEKTAGRVTLRYFEAGAESDERDLVRKIKLGQLDGAELTTLGLSTIDGSICVLELPTLFQSAEELDYVADKMWPYFRTKFEKKGFRLNERTEVGWVHFMSKAKMTSLADLRAQKLWMQTEDLVVRATYKRLGLQGVPLGEREVDPALTTGRIDAYDASPDESVSLEWYSKIQFATSMPMNLTIGASVVSAASFKKLSAEDQRTVQTLNKQWAARMRKGSRKANEDAKNAMTRKGVQFVPTPADTIAEFEKAAQEAWKDLAAPVGAAKEIAGKPYSQEELDMVLKYRGEFRAKKATAKSP